MEQGAVNSEVIGSSPILPANASLTQPGQSALLTSGKSGVQISQDAPIFMSDLLVKLGVWMWNKGPGYFFPAGALNNQAGPVMMLGLLWVLFLVAIVSCLVVLTVHSFSG